MFEVLTSETAILWLLAKYVVPMLRILVSVILDHLYEISIDQYVLIYPDSQIPLAVRRPLPKPSPGVWG